MSEFVGSKLPDPIAEQVRSSPPPPRAVPLVSTDDRGFPHVALLSLYELILLNETLYVFVGKSSRSASFLESRGRCTLLFLSRGSVYYVKSEAKAAAEVASRRCYRLKIEAVTQDFPDSDEGECELLSGLDFSATPEQLDQRLRLREEVVRSITPRPNGKS